MKLALASTAVALGLLAARIVVSGSGALSFLAWNLALAWVPLLVSTLITALARRRTVPALVLLAAGAAWLVFFPNAPYVVTDVVHLHERASAPLWFDIALLFAFIWTAGLCAVISLRHMHALVQARVGARLASVFVVVTALCTGFGIYLGRFDRWNSWDIVTRPRALAHGIVDILRDPSPRALGVTAVFALLLLVVYATTHAARADSPPRAL